MGEISTRPRWAKEKKQDSIKAANRKVAQRSPGRRRTGMNMMALHRYTT